MNVEIALSYLKKGFCVIPMANNLEGKKKPLVEWKKYKTAENNPHPLLPTEIEIQKLFEENKGCNIGTITGQLSNLLVVDCDNPETVAEVEAIHNKLNINCPTVKTRNGRHYYFRYREGLKTTRYGAGLDVRAEGGLVVLPPSRRGDFTYSWDSSHTLGKAPIPSLPDELLDYIVCRKSPEQLILFIPSMLLSTERFQFPFAHKDRNDKRGNEGR